MGVGVCGWKYSSHGALFGMKGMDISAGSVGPRKESEDEGIRQL